MKKPHTILLIDDDEDDRNFFVEAVNEIDKQIDCICITNGNEVDISLKLTHLFHYKLTTQSSSPDFMFWDA